MRFSGGGDRIARPHGKEKARRLVTSLPKFNKPRKENMKPTEKVRRKSQIRHAIVEKSKK